MRRSEKHIPDAFRPIHDNHARALGFAAEKGTTMCEGRWGHHFPPQITKDNPRLMRQNGVLSMFQHGFPDAHARSEQQKQ